MSNKCRYEEMINDAQEREASNDVDRYWLAQRADLAWRDFGELEIALDDKGLTKEQLIQLSAMYELSYPKGQRPTPLQASVQLFLEPFQNDIEQWVLENDLSY